MPSTCSSSSGVNIFLNSSDHLSLCVRLKELITAQRAHETVSIHRNIMNIVLCYMYMMMRIIKFQAIRIVQILHVCIIIRKLNFHAYTDIHIHANCTVVFAHIDDRRTSGCIASNGINIVRVSGKLHNHLGHAWTQLVRRRLH